MTGPIQEYSEMLTEDEIDDIIYFSRTSELDDLIACLKEISLRTNLTTPDILLKAKDDAGQTPLHMAAANGHLATATLLVSYFSSTSLPPTSSQAKHAFLNAQNPHGNTPLHWAAERGHVDLVKFLVSSGADPTIANKKGDIPLDSAHFGMREEVTAYFIAQNETLERERAAESRDGGAASLESVMQDVESEGREGGGL